MVLMEAKVFQGLDNSQCVTNLNYVGSGTPAAVSMSFALTAALGLIDGITPGVGDVFQAWRNSISSSLFVTEVQVKAVFSGTDFYTLPLVSNNNGIQTGEPSGSFIVFPFQTNRVRSDIRRGNRRIAGVCEDLIGSFGVITPTHLATLELLGDAFSDILTYDDEGNTLSFTPVVVSKEKYQTPAGNDAYRYYDSEVEQALHLAAGVAWLPKDVISSQVTRKRGRGI